MPAGRWWGPRGGQSINPGPEQPALARGRHRGHLRKRERKALQRLLDGAWLDMSDDTAFEDDSEETAKELFQSGFLCGLAFAGMSENQPGARWPIDAAVQLAKAGK